mmetsp:Transcript_30043/g.75617  ORF Transcript_30043/g.75617 Transcript_30043/m.75617 type:complete len:237 (-) Transcript_30043:1969-2679(-)
MLEASRTRPNCCTMALPALCTAVLQRCTSRSPLPLSRSRSWASTRSTASSSWSKGVAQKPANSCEVRRELSAHRSRVARKASSAGLAAAALAASISALRASFTRLQPCSRLSRWLANLVAAAIRCAASVCCCSGAASARRARATAAWSPRRAAVRRFSMARSMFETSTSCGRSNNAMRCASGLVAAARLLLNWRARSNASSRLLRASSLLGFSFKALQALISCLSISPQRLTASSS